MGGEISPKSLNYPAMVMEGKEEEVRRILERSTAENLCNIYFRY